jgi:hypothetical protein
MTDDPLRRAQLHEQALEEAGRAITRALFHAPPEMRRALLNARKVVRTHHEFAARDLRIQANHAATGGTK